MEIDIGRYAIMAAALAAGAVVKGATGMGLPLIALPVLASTLGLQHAVGIMVVVQIVTNSLQTWQFRAASRSDATRFLPLFLVGGAIGVLAGTWLLTNLPERVLILALGLLMIGYFVLKLTKPHLVVGPVAARRYGPIAGLGSGVLQGATGISAPIGVTFIHAMGLGRDAHLYAVSAMFLVLGIVQLPALIVSGVMQPIWVVEALFALVPIMMFMPVGQALAGRLSRQAFDRMILVFLGLVGLKMVLGL
ncbi:sulfite exporter TauE/SafE family protein [Devosia sp. FJ2-5-3]|uniref:sulfite exporter TauE/SafE family protein n=1 Tax=Devosia sp. FJ2-5-3 TaxID=2976680 RepID=UPI0023D8967B|nr:sulfite exporter TauE/SafE family protein [Devosia sp. FJ2-5-3]WEJ58831.1 sulfite exporter TauE/SafE family protein [Devosia sp. FJ2-5-3]